MSQDTILQYIPRAEWRVQCPQIPVVKQYIGRRVEVIAMAALREVFHTTGYWLLTFGIIQQMTFKLYYHLFGLLSL